MKFVIFIFLLFSLRVSCQNLLPNGDFEEQIICTEFDLPCGPMGWKLTTGESPRYLMKYIDVADENGDTVKSYTGKWASIVVKGVNNDNEREYLEAPILCPLVKGNGYVFSMEVKPEAAAICAIGVLFVHDYIYTRDNHVLYLKPQLVFLKKHFLKGPKNDWIKFTGTFTSDGTERYVLIGNFLDDAHTSVQGKKWFKSSSNLNYDIDNVSLLPKNHCPICDFSLYLDSIRADRRRHTANLKHLFPKIPIPEKLQASVANSLQPDTIVEGKPIVLRNLFFDVDKYDLLPQSFAELAKLVTWLLRHPGLTIDIRGHTDITGNEVHNQQLSLNRARAVADYLVSKGIKESRITCHGFASTMPVSTNNTPEGRQKNRRVEFVIGHK